MSEEQPPSYNEVPDKSGPPPPVYPSDVDVEENRSVLGREDVPPSYDSLFGRIKDARTTHGSGFGFFKALLSILAAALGGIVCVACVGALMALPIAQLVIGVQNQDNCTVNDNIPLFLILSGSFGIAAGVIQVFDQMCCKEGEGEDARSKCPLLGFILHLLNIACFAVFIAGNVWVYKIHKTVDLDDPTSDMYCSKLVYLFAFWTITAVYIIMGSTCLIGCCCICCLQFFS